MNGSSFERQGIKLAVAKTGAGKPMLFQHGLCGAAGQPAEVFPDNAGWSCVTLECRGHGKSEPGPLDALSIATFADDFAALIEAQGLAPAVIGGISMGAAISLRLAVRRPELVRGVVLARPAWLTEPAPENLHPNVVVGDLLERFSPAEALTRFDTSPLVQRLSLEAPDNLASLRGFFSREPVAVTAALLTQISSDAVGVSIEELAHLNVPTLVIGTARDFMHPLAMARTLVATIPGAQFAEITPKATDRSAYVRDFKAALAGFLEEIDA